MREALVSWNHAQDYDCPTYEDYAGRLGGGQFEKVYDLGARSMLLHPTQAGNIYIVLHQAQGSPMACIVPKEVFHATDSAFSASTCGCGRACAGYQQAFQCLDSNALAPGGEHKFLADHLIDGRILMPATSYVVTAWEALATIKGKPMAEVGVTFEDVIIHQAVAAEEGQKVALAVLLAPGHRFHVRPCRAWLPSFPIDGRHQIACAV